MGETIYDVLKRNASGGMADMARRGFDPSQPRDSEGKWTSSGAAIAGAGPGSKVKVPWIGENGEGFKRLSKEGTIEGTDKHGRLQVKIPGEGTKSFHQSKIKAVRVQPSAAAERAENRMLADPDVDPKALEIVRQELKRRKKKG